MPLRSVLHTSLLSAALLAANCVWAEAPPISDPEGRANGGMPGTYPTTVTAANVNAAPIADSVLNGTGSNNLLVSFPAAGPIKWTESRHNEGDIALLIGPFDPNDPSYYPPTTHFDNYAPIAGDPAFANTTLAWRVGYQTGALLASVRHNGVNNGDTYFGSPVGTIHGVAYFGQGGAQGWGFRLADGVFANGGESSSDLTLGIAGFDDSNGEAVFNTATSYFPYEQGWQGAWVNGGDEGAATFAGGATGLDPSAVTWTNGRATVNLPGVNSATDGMLFVASSHTDNHTKLAAAVPSNGGWNVAVRYDDELDPMNTLFGGENQFQFLYVPYSAGGLIGGQVQGSNGSMIHEEGGNRFDLVRTAAGEYRVTVFAADGVTPLSGNEGMLVMSVSSGLAADATIPDNSFLSYQYDPEFHNFVIQSREDLGAGPSENQFGDNLALRDSNFYFAWVDFANPLTPGAAGLAGDFDGDHQVDADDLQKWKDSFPGAGADADGDGDSDGADFLAWQQNLGAAAGVASVGAVPEPAAAMLMVMGVAALAAARKRIG